MKNTSTKKTTPKRLAAVPVLPEEDISKHRAFCTKTQTEVDTLGEDQGAARGERYIERLSLAGLLNEAVGGCEDDPIANVLNAAIVQAKTLYTALETACKDEGDIDGQAIRLFAFEVARKIEVARELVYREQVAARAKQVAAGGAS